MPSRSLPSVPLKYAANSGSALEKPMAHIDDLLSLSAALVLAKALDVKLKRERLRKTGELRHHIGLLSREKDSQELRVVYHLVKKVRFYAVSSSYTAPFVV